MQYPDREEAEPEGPHEPPVMNGEQRARGDGHHVEDRQMQQFSHHRPCPRVPHRGKTVAKAETGQHRHLRRPPQRQRKGRAAGPPPTQAQTTHGKPENQNHHTSQRNREA